MMATFSSSFVDYCIRIFWVSLWCLSRRWSDFTLSVLFVVIVIKTFTDRIREEKKRASSFSFVFHFCNLIWAYVWCFSRRWFDLIVFLIVEFLVTRMMISIYSDLLRIINRLRIILEKKMAILSCSFVGDFGSLYFVSLWCLPKCWYDFTMYVLFVGMVTSKILLLLSSHLDHFIIGGKKRRVVRGTMRVRVRGFLSNRIDEDKLKPGDHIYTWRVVIETMRMRVRGLLSNRIDEDKLKPGDHIYTWRNGYIYAHHGIYGGDGKVIHLTRGGGQKFGTRTTLGPNSSHSEDNAMNPCRTCGSELNRGGARVISSCMECFLSGGNLYLYHYDVSMAFFLFKLRGGTCTLAPSDPPEKVLDRAESLLSKDRNSKIRNVFADYNLMENNCENFAIYCKTGPCVCFDICPNTNFKTGDPHVVHRSGQVVSLVAAFSAVLLYLAFGFLGVIVGSGYYFFVRLNFDVGRHLECDEKVLHKRFVSPSDSEELEAMAEVANESKSP